jgi:CheY-like chemotaxis protein
LREAHAAGDSYQIAILDYQMPEMDGEMLGQVIKADPLLHNIQLVMLSSLGQEGDIRERLKKVGFAAYLVKPARQSELLSTLGSIWDAHCHQRSTNLISSQSSLPDIHETRTAHSLDRPFTGTRVLLAEDNATNQIVGAMILRNLGCNVDVAASGREAMQMIETFFYHIVFMDCEMPEMDGFETTAAIRRRPDRKSRLPIVAVTAQAMQGDKERCLLAGMDDYISKPVRQEDFAVALTRWVPGKELQNKGEAKEHITRSNEKTGNANAPDYSPSPVSSSLSGIPAALDPVGVARLRALAEATEQ